MSDEGTRIDGDRVSTSLEKILGILWVIGLMLGGYFWHTQSEAIVKLREDYIQANRDRQHDHEEIVRLQTQLQAIDGLEPKVENIDKKLTELNTKWDDHFGSGVLRPDRRSR